MVPLSDVQGLILRSYGMDSATFFLLRVERPSEARRLLAGLPVTSGTLWDKKPDFCLNIALTHEGLAALELPADTLQSFPEEFIAGAHRRCSEVGDTGDCAPDKWEFGLGRGGLHVMVLLFAQTAAIRDMQEVSLREQFTRSGALSQIAALRGDVLPGSTAHFGYRDGFSQPTIDCGLVNPVPDKQPVAPTGEFLLGYPSQFDQLTYPIPQPEALGLNGSFMVLRVLEQNCIAFEKLLAEAESKYGINGELLAAKMVGRWRNGTPLTVSPDTDSPMPELTVADLNTFDYAPTDANPEALNDRRGYRCPIGSHMRRINPRGATVAGNSGSRHRIVRRGLPYGPAYDPNNPDDGIKRGLLGLFIGVSIKDQYEFLMSEWVNGDSFAPGIGGTVDPILGNPTEGVNKFSVPRENAKPIVIESFPLLVTTRGAAYTFLPSLTGLRFLGEFTPSASTSIPPERTSA